MPLTTRDRPEFETGPDAAASLDDLFADINWPEDLQDGLSEKNYYTSRSGSIHCNSNYNESSSEAASPKDKPNGTNLSLHNSPVADECTPQAETSNCPSAQGRASSRFSKQAKSVLRTWFHEHRDDPYPTSEEKDELAAKTHLKRSQISLWLVNTRRRYRSQKHLDRRTSATALHEPLVSASFDSGQASISSPSQHAEDMNPMDRWKALPLEFEAVAAPVILATVAASSPPPPEPQSAQLNNPTWDQQTVYSSHCDTLWAQSLASYETGFTGTTMSDSTAFSHQFSHSSSVSRDRRRRRQYNNKSPKPSSKDRPFQCTFCNECFFSTKHDWQRHEKSQHLSLESWTCCLSGGTLPSPTGPICAFCGSTDPTTAHLETHSFSACISKSLSERSFYRKDHFQQHLRLTHECSFDPRMHVWKSEIQNLQSRCGFCSATFSTWAARADHLAAHFKSRTNMRDWRGDWGFEPHVMALVERADVSAVSGQESGGPTSAGVMTAITHPKVKRPSMPPPSLPRSQMQTSKAGQSSLGMDARTLPTIYGLPELDLDLNLCAGMDLGMNMNLGFPFDAGGGSNIDYDHYLDLEPNLELDAMLLKNSSVDLDAIVDTGDWGPFVV